MLFKASIDEELSSSLFLGFEFGAFYGSEESYERVSVPGLWRHTAHVRVFRGGELLSCQAFSLSSIPGRKIYNTSIVFSRVCVSLK